MKKSEVKETLKKGVVKGALIGGLVALVAWILAFIGLTVPALEFLAVAAGFILLPFELIFGSLIGILGELLGELFWRYPALQPIGPIVAALFTVVAYAAIGALIGYLVDRSSEKKAKLLSRA